MPMTLSQKNNFDHGIQGKCLGIQPTIPFYLQYGIQHSVLNLTII